MVDIGNAQLSSVGFFNPMLGMGDAVGMSGGGAGGDVIGGVFDISDEKIVRCALVFGRKWLQCDDTALGILVGDKEPSGVIYAEVAHSSGSPTLSVKHKEDGKLPDNSLSKSYRALYYAYQSEDATSWLWADVRFQPAMFAMN